MLIKMGKFEIYKDKRGEFRFRLKARNGQVIISSEGYGAKSGCKKGVNSVRNNSSIDSRYERLTSKGGSPYFNLKAVNGQVIGKSELYSFVASMENGIAFVKINASDAILDEIN